MEDQNESLTVTLAMDNDTRRAAVIELLNEMRLSYTVIKIGMYIKDVDVLARSSVVILDPNDDAASLVHIVHEIYKLFPSVATLPIIGLLSARQWDLNPRFGYWVIDHHAAISILLVFDKPEWLTYLRNIIHVLTKNERSKDETGS